jgi:uncharacterized protein
MTNPTGRPRGRPPKTIVKVDGYSNAFSGSGSRADRSVFTRIHQAVHIDQNTAANIYMGSGLGRRIADLPAMEMTRAGVDFENMDEKVEDAVLAKFDDLAVMHHFADGLRWADVFGGSVIVMGINDGGQLDQPLNESGIKSVEFLRVYDRYQTSVKQRYADPMNPGYGKVELWMISPHTGGQPYMVHESRVLILDGDPVPDLQRSNNDGWGASKYQSVHESLMRFKTSHQWANSLLERAQQAVHSIPELANILRSVGGEASIQKRVDVVDMVRGMLNTIVIDGQETYELKSTSFSGVHEIMDRLAEALASDLGWPMYLLVGRSPGGLSATGGTNEEAWLAKLQATQNDKMRSPLNRLVQIILLSISGDTGGDWELCFNPLKVPSEKEEAEIEKLEAETKKAKADTAVALVGIGALDPREVRAKIAEDYDIIGEIPETAQPDDEAILVGNNGSIQA